MNRLSLSLSCSTRSRRFSGALAGSAVVSIALSVLLIGCGNSETVDGKTQADSQAIDVIEVDAAIDSAGADDILKAKVKAKVTGATEGPRVELESELAADQTLTVRVVVRDFDNLYAIATHLTWDPKQVVLLSAKGHAMMQSSGYDSRTLAKASGAGRLLLGAARFRDGGSPWAKIDGVKVSNQLWATLQFKLTDGFQKDGKQAILRFDPDHSMAKNSSYKVVKTGWQQLQVVRSGVADGGGQ